MIYLDNAATTRVYPEAAKTAVKMMTKLYSNPASLHSFGFDAENVLEESRATVAKAVGCKSDEIYFTPSGTAADNTAILGYLKGKRRGRVITSAYEHPAVLECFKEAEKDFDVVYIKPDKDGTVSEEALKEALTPDTLLVSIMHVNNETGAKNPIAALSRLTHTVKGAVFHTDAVQSFMKEDIRFSCVDLASFSAHKTHAPKGIGALYVRSGIKVKPILFGGGQENGMFPATSNVPGAAAWATAIKMTDIKKNHEKVLALNMLTSEKLTELGAKIISPKESSPYVLNVMFEGYIAENLLHWLSGFDIYVSTGSACSSKHGSHVFSALGLEKYRKNALRFSFSEENSEAEIIKTAEVLKEGLGRILRKQ